LKCKIYSWCNVRRNADHVLFIGDFSAEPSQELVDYGRKLLCARMQSILTTAISDDIVESIYSNLRPISGKQGFEVTRLGGTGGYTCDQSTKDLLYILKQNDSLLPRKAGACLIIPSKKFYSVYYMRNKTDPETSQHPVAYHKYSPPKPGGSFMLDGTILNYFKIIGEFGYLKMVVTLLLQTMNDQCLDIMGYPVCKGPIHYEMRNIDYARGAFQINKSYASLCKAFISVNSMTLISWPVGQHNDHFSKNVESLENKILFVVPSEKKSNGRGGSLIGSQFVFALLDWRSTNRQARRFYVTHATDMGIGPPQNLNAQRHLTEYFNTGTKEAKYWQNQFNNFLS
jgi:hypothetical protein